MLFLPLVWIVEYLLALGMTIPFSAVTVYFQDTSHILKTAKSLNELIHRDFCSKYCDKKKFTNEECPLRKYREFILSLEQEMTSILNCGRYSERK